MNYPPIDVNRPKGCSIFIRFLWCPQVMVKRLMTHYSLYAKLNSTTLSPDHLSELNDWQSFLTNNSDFINPFDFVKDMAVEDPGDRYFSI